MPEVDPPLLEIQLLRGPTVTTDGETVEIPGRLRRRLLWRLAVAGGALVDTEDLIAVVWPTDPPRTAAGMIGSHVARLRSLLADHGLPADQLLPRSDGGYRIDGATTRVDVHALAGRVADCREAGPGDPAGLDRAVADLHRFVPATDDAAADSEPWLRDAVDAGWLSVREICRLALDTGAGAAGTAAELDARRVDVFAAVSALARRWPYDETVAAWQVELLARSGRPAEALRAVATIRDRLADELGVSPSAELTHAHELALGLSVDAPPSSEPATAPPSVIGIRPPRPLPQPPTPLIGRHRELARLRELTAGPATVLITGAAGVGKSGLALQLAAELAGRFPHGQLYLDLYGPGGTDDPDADVGEAAGAALALLGVPPTEQPRRTADRAALLRSVTATTPMLWVLDNVRPQHGLAPLLPTEPDASVIVTSVVAHPDLATVPRHELARLTDPDIDRLLVALVGADRLRGDVTGRRRIVASCEGLPAAARGMAGRIEELDHLPLSVLADRLGDDGDRLDQFSAGSHGVTAALDLSRDGLPETARRVLPGLGLLPPGVIDPERLAAVVELPVAGVMVALDDLVRAGLVEWDAADPTPGHRVSGMIGRYALRSWLADHTTVETAAARARAGLPDHPGRPRLVSGDG